MHVFRTLVVPCPPMIPMIPGRTIGMSAFCAEWFFCSLLTSSGHWENVNTFWTVDSMNSENVLPCITKIDRFPPRTRRLKWSKVNEIRTQTQTNGPKVGKNKYNSSQPSDRWNKTKRAKKNGMKIATATTSAPGTHTRLCLRWASRKLCCDYNTKCARVFVFAVSFIHLWMEHLYMIIK